jgi:phosphatidylinositol-3-phosphatase
LLRTTEAAFGLSDYLGHAADVAAGVKTMTPLLAVTPAPPAGRSHI